MSFIAQPIDFDRIKMENELAEIERVTAYYEKKIEEVNKVYGYFLCPARVVWFQHEEYKFWFNKVEYQSIIAPHRALSTKELAQHCAAEVC